MAAAEVIELRLSDRRKTWYKWGGLAAIGLILYLSVAMKDQDLPTVQAIGLFCTLLLGFLFWRSGRKGIGDITLDDNGITIDTNSMNGHVGWQNFEKAGILRPLEKTGVKALLAPVGLGLLADQTSLGIAVVDAGGFIASREGRKFRHSLDATLLKMGNRAVGLARAPGMDTVMKMTGMENFPIAGSEAEILKWCRSTYGYEICIPIAGVADAEDIPRRIERRRPFVPAEPAPPRPVPREPAATTPVPPAEAKAEETDAASADAAVPAGYKLCPMCAEHVREAARICRYCRHSFEGVGQQS
jgi:hypothetical protein